MTAPAGSEAQGLHYSQDADIVRDSEAVGQSHRFAFALLQGSQSALSIELLCHLVHPEPLPDLPGLLDQPRPDCHFLAA